jgi:hypothetical protein
MVLVEVIFNFFATPPTIILRTNTSNMTFANGPLIPGQIRFLNALLTCIDQCNFAVSLNWLL